MGDPRRQKSKTVTPSHPWEKTRIKEELQQLGEYGLRNKTELWKTRTQLRHFREFVRKLRTKSAEEQKIQFKDIVGKLQRLGLLTPGDHTFDDVLNLTIREFLERRLQTYIYKQGLVKSIYQARQVITHRHIAVDGQIIDSPSYHVQAKDEGKVTFAAWSPFANKEHPLYQAIQVAADGQVASGEGDRPPRRSTDRRPRKGGRFPQKEEGKGEESAPEPAGDVKNLDEDE